MNLLKKDDKILIIQLRAIGDVVLTTPAAALLNRAYPDAKIHFLTNPAVAPLLRGLPFIDEVLEYPWPPDDLLGPFRLLPRLRRAGYRVVIDYQCTPGTAILTRFSGAQFRLGWQMERRQWAYNRVSAANREQVYVAHQKCLALGKLGVKGDFLPTRLAVPGETLQVADAYLQSLQLPPGSFLVNMTPLGKRPARTWEAEKVVRLADLLTEKHGATIFFNAAPGERAAAETIAGWANNPIHLVPDWPLPVFAAFLSRVHLHFSYDNGPKHLAIALETPTVSLFATDSPVLWQPPGDARHRALVANVPCRFCGLRSCNLMLCMKQIEPETVLAEIEQLLPLLRKSVEAG